LKSLLKYFGAGCFLLASLAIFSLDAHAQDKRSLDLTALLKELVQTHDRVKASEAQLQAVQHQYKRAQGGWYPKVDATVEGGRENLSKPSEAESQMNRNQQSLSATQLLYDFGGTSGSIDSAAGRVKEYEAQLARAKQVVISSGITAYLRVIRSRELLKYARRSENSMKELSGMQEVLVQRGAGYSYEELQVKGQLAGAQSYRVTQERELQMSINNFKSVFGFSPTLEEVSRMNAVPLPRKFLPSNMEEAVSVAFDTNPTLLETKYTMDRLQGDLRSQEANYYPQFDAVLEGERKENDQGSAGIRSEQRATVMMTYNLFSGFEDTESINAVKSEMTGAKRTLLDRRRTVEESVRNAWLELTTLRQNSDLYENQANITWEFLGLVKKKKATGEEVRLLDILVGERDYISSISLKVATDIDIIIAAYTLLYEMGVITEDITSI
jgi:adhesin transport system outer membrane protein